MICGLVFGVQRGGEPGHGDIRIERAEEAGGGGGEGPCDFRGEGIRGGIRVGGLFPCGFEGAAVVLEFGAGGGGPVWWVFGVLP